MTRQPIYKAAQLTFSLLMFVLALHALPAQASAEILLRMVDGFVRDSALSAHPEAGRIEINIKAPDARISLKNCTEPTLTLHGTKKLRSKLLVRAECDGNMAQYISVDLAIYQPIVVTNETLARKHVLQADDLALTEVNILTQHRAVFSAIEEVTGKMLKRTTSRGSVLTSGMLSLPSLVERGDNVVIIASKGGIEVRMPGTALAKGSMGQQISVRNTSSERVIKGWVMGPGEVRVPM